MTNPLSLSMTALIYSPNLKFSGFLYSLANCQQGSLAFIQSINHVSMLLPQCLNCLIYPVILSLIYKIQAIFFLETNTNEKIVIQSLSHYAHSVCYIGNHLGRPNKFGGLRQYI